MCIYTSTGWKLSQIAENVTFAEKHFWYGGNTVNLRTFSPMKVTDCEVYTFAMSGAVQEEEAIVSADK